MIRVGRMMPPASSRLVRDTGSVLGRAIFALIGLFMTLTVLLPAVQLLKAAILHNFVRTPPEIALLRAATTATTTTASSSPDDDPNAIDFPINFTILHTNDLHAHVEGLSPDDMSYFHAPFKIGGFARLARLILDTKKQKRRIGEPVLTLDAGDWSQGTLFSYLGPSLEYDSVPELEFLDACGYDAITFGNHEFDVSTEKVALMLRKAAYKNLTLPFVASNLVIQDPHDPFAEFFCGDVLGHGTISNETMANKPYCTAGVSRVNVRPYIVKEIPSSNGQTLRVGIFGLFSPDSAWVSFRLPGRKSVSIVGFDDNVGAMKFGEFVDAAQNMIDVLRRKEHVDVVVVLSHSGFPEDAHLVSRLRGLDLHISAHTHKRYLNVLSNAGISPTIVTQTDSNGMFLGALELSFFPKTRRLILRNHPHNRRENDGLLDNHIPITSQLPATESGSSGFSLDRINRYKHELNGILHHDGHLMYDTFMLELEQPLQRDDPSVAKTVASMVLKELNYQFAHPQKHRPRKTSDSHHQHRCFKCGFRCSSHPRPLDIYFSSTQYLRSDLNGWDDMNRHSEEARKAALWDTGISPNGTRYQYSDVFKLLAVGEPLVTFYILKSDFIFVMEFMNLYDAVIGAELCPFYSDTLSFRWSLFGIPLVNRLADLQLHGLPFDEWPELLHIGTVYTIAKYFHLFAKMNDRLEVHLREESGAVIPPSDLFSACTLPLYERTAVATYIHRQQQQQQRGFQNKRE